MSNKRALLSTLFAAAFGWGFPATVFSASEPLTESSVAKDSATANAAEDENKVAAFKISITDTGVYRLTYEALVAAGASGELTSAKLGMTNRGSDVPIWVEDGGDGRLGPGDHIEFIGEHLAGVNSYFDDYARFNIYRLAVDGKTAGTRMRSLSLTPEVDADQPEGAEETTAPLQQGALAGHLHLEQDSVMVRFTGQRDQEHAPELWFWKRLNHSDKAPFEIELDLRDRRLPEPQAAPAADAEASQPEAVHPPVSLRLHLRGWSSTVRKVTDREGVPDHLVKVWLNKTLLATATWNGQAEHLIEVPDVPAEALNPVRNVLRIRVPKRLLEPGKPLIDAVLLNWVEVDFPHGGRLSVPGHSMSEDTLLADDTAAAPADVPAEAARQHRLTLRGGVRTVVDMGAPDATTLTVYGDDGSRFEAQLGSGDASMVAVPAFQDEGQIHAVLDQDLRVPSGVAPDLPSDLRNREQQADYLMVTVAALRDAVQPLAAFHREQGLQVKVVDVEDIYDEFNDSITHPKAIRDFVHHAYHAWQEPAPRFVLLVGDASWDVRSQQPNDANYADWVFRGLNRRDFLKNKSTAYEGDQDRNLIPTWRYESMQGHAASDNYFVAVDGDDFHPDLAIGRFPIATAGETADIVRKTIQYARESGVGPWRRRMLWITNEHENFKRRTDRVALSMTTQGFEGEKVYPSPDETDNATHQVRLREAFDDGQVLVHFYGHGGRYIWRTGPPDYRKNHDLFTLDDLESLEPNARLPLVLSMSCYSAPFDHPTADSIGEKFLRLPGRGAVAVFAASWRNSPSIRFSRNLLDALVGHETIGEAIQDAKRQSKSRLLVETYNLLGDPAIALALPRLPVSVNASATAEGWRADVVVDPEETLTIPFTGQAVVDWLDVKGDVLFSQTVEVKGPQFTIERPRAALAADTATADLTTDATATIAEAVGTDDGEPVTVRVYVWNERFEIDGMAGQPVVTDDTDEAPRQTAQLGH